MISNFNSNAPVIQSFSTGGIDPVAALGVDVAGNGLESLVVANSGDGLFTLLGNTGADGLEVEATLANPALRNRPRWRSTPSTAENWSSTP